MKNLEQIIYNQKRNRYKRTDLSLYDRFWAEEKESEEWLKEALDISKEQNLERKKELIDKLTFNGKLSFDLKKENIDRLIDKFTKINYSNEMIDQDIELYNKLCLFANGRRDGREAIIFDINNKKTVVRSLSGTNPALLSYFPELETKERNRKCHEGSIKIARVLGMENMRVTTGSYFVVSPKSMVLHSVAEGDIGGEPFVIDYDSNTIWEQEDFYKFYNFEPFESISQATLNEDMEDLLYLLQQDKDYAKLYLTSRDEAINKVKELKGLEENQNN